MVENEYPEEKLIDYVRQIKKKEQELSEREQKLKQAEESSVQLQNQKRIKSLESQIDQMQTDLKAKEEAIKVIRDAAGMSSVSTSEEKLKVKEAELYQRESEIAKREAAVSGDYSAARDVEFKEEKAKTGNQRLDDLLYGGIEFGNNVLVMGPPFIGKETLAHQFILEGLIKGIPAVIITTDCEPKDIMDELRYMTPDPEKYLKDGSLVFIDAYSKPMGLEESNSPGIKYVNNPTNYAEIEKALSETEKEFKEKSSHFRTVVRSISSMVTLSDPVVTYKFLQKLTGKNKHHKNVAVYFLDKGMHNEAEIQTLGHLMDGAIETKTDGIKTYLSVQGFGEVRSRAWIQYKYSKKGLDIGSFSTDHIR